MKHSQIADRKQQSMTEYPQTENEKKMQSQILYLECSAGISGDMTVAALLDLGADESKLRAVLESLPVSGYEIDIHRVSKSGIDCCSFDVLLDEAHENHDHDMAYLHGAAEHVHDHDHTHGEEHTHDHEEHEHLHIVHSFDGLQRNVEVIAKTNGIHIHDQNHIHAHSHRGLPEILKILEAGSMTEGAREMAVKIFRILAGAEAKAHGVPMDQVHFHEVGAVDSIVDIVAAAVCLDDLGVKQVVIPGVCEGTGTVRCQHGVLPVPVPAVLNILQTYQIPTQIINVRGEFVTPTGAAIVAAFRTGEHLPEHFLIRKTGMGAGKREYERPSILRAMLLEEVTTGKKNITSDISKKDSVRRIDEASDVSKEESDRETDKAADVLREDSDRKTDKASDVSREESDRETDKAADVLREDSNREIDKNSDCDIIKCKDCVKTDTVSEKENAESVQRLERICKNDSVYLHDTILKLETNIDDCSGELLGYVMERLLQAGAKDVHYTPVYMKKNRPAWQLNVICDPQQAEQLEQIIFRETTTIGIRHQIMDRTILPRQQMSVKTDIGTAEVKVCVVKDEIRCYPEYESVKALCAKTGVSYHEVYQKVTQAGKDVMMKRGEIEHHGVLEKNI